MDIGENETTPEKVTKLDSAKRGELIARRAARGVAPKSETDQDGGEGTVTPLESNRNYAPDPDTIINKLVAETIRPQVFRWLQELQEMTDEQTRNATANELAHFLLKNPDATLSEIDHIIWD